MILERPCSCESLDNHRQSYRISTAASGPILPFGSSDFLTADILQKNDGNVLVASYAFVVYAVRPSIV